MTFHVILHVNMSACSIFLPFTCRFAVAFTDRLKEQAEVLLVRDVVFITPIVSMYSVVLLDTF